MVSVVLGEDSYLAREGISRALEGIEEIELVASCGELGELLEAVERLRPDVVLSDVRMPPSHTDEGVRAANELRRALLEVSRGGTVVDPEIVNELLAVRGQRETTGLETLTGREREILALVAEGRSNADIAQTVVITKRAVEGHINSIFSKLELGDPDKVDRRVKAALLYLTG